MIAGLSDSKGFLAADQRRPGEYRQVIIFLLGKNSGHGGWLTEFARGRLRTDGNDRDFSGDTQSCG
jgi:hypothetical protein